MSKKTFTGSHEDLLHPSPSVPYALSGTGLGSGGDRIPPKDRFPLKKKKEEKKNKVNTYFSKSSMAVRTRPDFERGWGLSLEKEAQAEFR